MAIAPGQDRPTESTLVALCDRLGFHDLVGTKLRTAAARQDVEAEITAAEDAGDTERADALRKTLAALKSDDDQADDKAAAKGSTATGRSGK